MTAKPPKPTAHAIPLQNIPCLPKSACLLAELFLDLAAFDPVDRPFGRPWARVSQRVVDRDFVTQRREIRSRKSFRQAQGFRVGQAAVREPEPRVEPARLDDQRIVLPTARRVTIISARDFFGIRRLAVRPVKYASSYG